MKRPPPRDPAHRQAAAPDLKLRPEAFPALTGFLKGYLHEDFLEVHGSARAAAVAFCAEAMEDERRLLAQELAALLRAVAGRPVRDLRRFVTRDLGSRWEPASRRELSALLDLVRAAH